MKTYIKTIALPMLAMAGLLTTSCELTEDNPHAGDASIQSFQSWEGLQKYCYSCLNDELYTASDWMISSEGGTDLWVAKANGDGYRADFYYESFSTNNNSTKKLWQQCYSMITNCNTVINEADKLIDGDPDVIRILVAEAKVLRGFYNYLLVSNFGPVTLNLESSASLTGNTNLRPSRSSEKDFYNQIEKDLTEAIPELGVTPYDDNKARVTKKTAIGLLARVYAQRAGLGKKYGDAEKYWKLAAETAEELINNAGTYGAYLYTDIADMWADANNRSNREALFIAGGADSNSEAFSATVKRNKLLAYSSGGLYDDLFGHNPTKNGQCYFYGRYNQQVWMPSKYLLYCFNPEWDRRSSTDGVTSRWSSVAGPHTKQARRNSPRHSAQNTVSMHHTSMRPYTPTPTVTASPHHLAATSSLPRYGPRVRLPGMYPSSSVSQALLPSSDRKA